MKIYMKKLKLITALFTLTLLVQCKKGNECKEHDQIQCNLIDISEEYNPVCGCDGTTYKNEAYAQCVGGITKYSEGECN